MKRVLLIYPYFYTGRKKDQIFPPLGIATLSALLRKKGFEVMTLDCTFLSVEKAVEKAKEFRPQITGIYVMTTLLNNALEILERLKIENPEGIYTAGGPLASLYPERFAEKFDYVVTKLAVKPLASAMGI